MNESSTTTDVPTTITSVTRPRTRDDLPDYQRADHGVVTIHDNAHLTRFPDLGKALLDVITAAQASGLTWDHTTGVVTLPLTDDEVDEKIAAAQREWDRNRDDYLRAVADPASIAADWRRSSINRWAQAEGQPAIDWTEASA